MHQPRTERGEVGKVGLGVNSEWLEVINLLQLSYRAGGKAKKQGSRILDAAARICEETSQASVDRKGCFRSGEMKRGVRQCDRFWFSCRCQLRQSHDWAGFLSCAQQRRGLLSCALNRHLGKDSWSNVHGDTTQSLSRGLSHFSPRACCCTWSLPVAVTHSFFDSLTCKDNHRAGCQHPDLAYDILTCLFCGVTYLPTIESKQHKIQRALTE